MLELYTVQQRGFHNTYDQNGEIDGFEFRYIPKYYKGLWFAQCRFGNVTVDGVVYDRDELIFEYDCIEYTREEMFDSRIYWQFREPLIIKVKKPGGLSIGYHEVSVDLGWVLNYNGGPEKEADGSGLGNSGFFSLAMPRKMLLCR